MIQKASLLLAAGLFAGVATAQTPTVTPLDKQLSRIDIGLSGVGEYNTTVTGTITPVGPNTGRSVTDQPSNTLGALVSVRYIMRPYVGFEGNYGYARYTENYSGPGTASFVSSPYGVQSNVAEETLGYVVTPPHTVFGFQPFVSVGAGTVRFRPTARGGQGERQQYRAGYYYSVGLQQEYANGHFGLRASFRQLIFLAPDFGDNYLTILKHTSTYEPGVGFYFRF